MSDENALASLLGQELRFPPPAGFAAGATANDPAIYERAAADPEAFWAEEAARLRWTKPWHTVCEFEAPDAKWFLGGEINACDVCVDRWAEAFPDRRAIVWEGEPGDVRTLTYAELRDGVARIAGALRELGVEKGDRVSVYLPMVPELPMTMLACARLGAAHTVVFGGFSADSLAERTNDAGAEVIVTADGGWRRGKVVPLLEITEEAVAECPNVRRVLVLERAGGRPLPDDPRFVAWADIVPRQDPAAVPPVPMDAEDLLFVLYTSGSTGKPKGIVHTTGGYLTGVAATSRLVFDLKPESDLHFCTADCGWITGHSYIVYGPLANGATVLLYEGAPDAPDKDRLWRIIERHRATILYTAPTAIRSFMKWGDEYPARCDLSSLRLLGSVGEPINPEAWLWYRRVIGGERCPVVDTWWQTETGAIMIAPLPGLTTTKPGSATRPLPGISATVVDESGGTVPVPGPGGVSPPDSAAHLEQDAPTTRGGTFLVPGPGGVSPPASAADLEQDAPGTREQDAPTTFGKGILVLDRPWPSMTRGIFGDPERFRKVYWDRFPGRYFAGDGAAVDGDGDFWLLGRVDDIMLVAGHNVSTMEVESALVAHPAVAEAAVIGKTHEIKGQAIACFVILRTGETAEPNALKAWVAHRLGVVCRPDDVFLVAELPKTRSGKIMRRLLRDIAEGRAVGDVTTLADPGVLNSLKTAYDEA